MQRFARYELVLSFFPWCSWYFDVYMYNRYTVNGETMFHELFTHLLLFVMMYPNDSVPGICFLSSVERANSNTSECAYLLFDVAINFS